MNNYDKMFYDEVNKLDHRPNLLVHVCCGPCSVYPLVLLNKYFNITIYYANSNIFPYQEYEKRIKTLEEYLKILNEDIKLIIPPYDKKFMAKLAPYATCKEGMERCAKCYSLRMLEAYNYAKKHNFEYFTTIMSISNHKNANYINRIGYNLEKRIGGVKYLYADFKKQSGIDNNRKMNKELNLYEQDYCGCIYSLNDYKKKLSSK